MTKYNTINKYLFVFMAIMLLAASMLFGAKANLKLHAEEEITDLSGTTWTIKKPSEWVYGGVPESYMSKISFSINYIVSYSTYTSAEQSNLHLTRYSNPSNNLEYVGASLATVAPFIYPRFVINNTRSGSSSVTYQNGEDELQLGDVQVTLNIIDGDDATNESANFATLLTWLQANATPVPAQEPSTGVVVDVVVMSLSSLVALLTLSVLLVNNHKKQKI